MQVIISLLTAKRPCQKQQLHKIKTTLLLNRSLACLFFEARWQLGFFRSSPINEKALETQLTTASDSAANIYYLQDPFVRLPQLLSPNSGRRACEIVALRTLLLRSSQRFDIMLVTHNSIPPRSSSHWMLTGIFSLASRRRNPFTSASFSLRGSTRV